MPLEFFAWRRERREVFLRGLPGGAVSGGERCPSGGKRVVGIRAVESSLGMDGLLAAHHAAGNFDAWRRLPR